MKVFNGDVNGDGRITLEDYLIVELFILGKMDLSPEQIYSADTNDNNKVDDYDLATIKEHILGKFFILETKGN